MLENIKDLVIHTKKMKILYVEDNQSAREQTLKFFSGFFGEIVTAVDGQDGFDKFKKDSFDLVVTDINMPKMNGIEMLKHIREIDLYTPCIIMSAYDETNFFLETIKLGIDGYILKPFNVEMFSNVLKKIVNNMNIRKDNESYMITLENLVDKKNKRA